MGTGSGSNLGPQQIQEYIEDVAPKLPKLENEVEALMFGWKAIQTEMRSNRNTLSFDF